MEQFAGDLRRLESILSEIRSEGGKPVTGLWPSNQATLRVLPMLDSRGFTDLKQFDIDPEKQGLEWGGSGRAVRFPSENEVKTCSHFLLLSPTHNTRIRASLREMGVEDSRIFEF